MRVISEVSNQARQKFRLVGRDNQPIDFTLFYQPTQQAWYYNISSNGFALNGKKLVNSPNLLEQYKNKITFGLGCVVNDGLDPYFLDDFVDGRARIILLDADEVQQISEAYLGG